MALFHFGVATEANDYVESTVDMVYIRGENGLELFGGVEDDDNQERK